jgi:hypothetical protein
MAAGEVGGEQWNEPGDERDEIKPRIEVPARRDFIRGSPWFFASFVHLVVFHAAKSRDWRSFELPAPAPIPIRI